MNLLRHTLLPAILLLLFSSTGNLHAAPPANDNLANATKITGTSAAVSADNTNATQEAGESHYQTLWWKWTAPANGRVTLASVNSVANDLRMRVYIQEQAGTTAGFIGGDDSNFPSMSFPVVTGTTIAIRLGSSKSKGSYGLVLGTVNLSVNLNTNDPVGSLSLAHACTMRNDSFAERITLTGNTASAVGYNYSASNEAGEPSPSGYGTFWWTYRPTANGRLTFTTTNSDDFGKRVAVYIGGSLSSLRLVEYASNSLVNFSIPVTAGTDYQISVGSSNTTTSYNGSGSFVFGLSLNIQSDISSLNIPNPATMINDAFAQRINLIGDTVSAVAYNPSTTSEAGDPSTSGYGTFWWTYRPSANGRLTISNQGSDSFQHRIAVYIGTTLPNLRLVSYASGYPFTGTIPVTAGVDYIISTGSSSQIGSYNTTGSLVLSLSLDKNSDISQLNFPTPATSNNDNFANKVLLSGNTVSAIGYNLAATREALEPIGTKDKTLWWSWLAAASGEVILDFTGSDTTIMNYGVVGIWQGSALNSLTENTGIPGRLAFNAVAGQTYHISVGTKNSNYAGSIVMTIYGAPAAPIFTITPESRWVALGSALELLAAADVQTGNYQWTKNGSKIAGGTGPTLNYPSVTLPHSGIYQVKATNEIGTASSEQFHVGVIGKTDTEVGIIQGGKLTLSVLASGPAPLNYRWMKDGNDIFDGKNGKQVVTGTGTAKLSITLFDQADQGTYTCRVGMTDPQHPSTPLTTESGDFNVVVRLKPEVTSLTVPSAEVAREFTWTLEASESPTKFIVKGLPKGLTVNTATGDISGKPSAAGTFKVKVSAQNSVATGPAHEFLLVVAPLVPGLAGNYNALIDRDNDLNEDLGGSLSISVLTSGNLSGSLILGSKKYSFKGPINIPNGLGDPSFTLAINRPKQTSLDLVLNFDPDTDRLLGTVKSNEHTANLTGWANRWSKTNQPSSRGGFYNVVLQIPFAQQEDESVPQGSGFFQIKLNGSTGVAVIKGQAPDGIAFTQSRILWPNGDVPIHALLQKNKAALLGHPKIIEGDSPSYDNNRVIGVLNLYKTGPISTTDRLYKDGYGPLDLVVDGSKWFKPAAKTMLFGWADETENARVEFADGDIESADQADLLSQTFQLTTTNTGKFASILDGNPCNVTLKVNVTTGLFGGTFKLQDVNPSGKAPLKRSIKYSGILIHHLEEGYGWFQLPELSEPLSKAPIKVGSVWFGTP